MILRKQWGNEVDKDTSFFRDALSILDGISRDAMVEYCTSPRITPQWETIAAFDLSSIICQTRQWEWPWALRQVYDHKGYVRDSKVLDIGCGFRPFTLLLNHLCLDVTAVDDMSWEFKEDLNTLLGSRGINFVNADARDLPFDDGEFDYSFCISVIEHCEENDIEQIISEGRRVTKSDGLFIVTVDACAKVRFLLPDEPAPSDVVSTFDGMPTAGIVFSGGVE